VNSLNVNLDFGSGVPIYIQIVDQVKALLFSGDLKPGDQLPTVRQLASELRVNFNTIARAYRLLDEARLISTQRGRGTYLLEASPSTDSDLIKSNSLDAQMQGAVRSLVNQGYSLEEIQLSLRNILKQNENN
jgi:GntR family transcriptional regulator